MYFREALAQAVAGAEKAKLPHAWGVNQHGTVLLNKQLASGGGVCAFTRYTHNFCFEYVFSHQPVYEGTLAHSRRPNEAIRLTRFYEHLADSQQAIDLLTERYNGYVRMRQAATHSYVGFDAPISRMRNRVSEASARIDLLMARQGRMLEQVAVRELENRVRRLEGYEERARYALADSYDRATAAQVDVLTEQEAEHASTVSLQSGLEGG